MGCEDLRMLVRVCKSNENIMLKVKCGFVNILESNFQIQEKESQGISRQTHMKIILFLWPSVQSVHGILDVFIISCKMICESNLLLQKALAIGRNGLLMLCLYCFCLIKYPWNAGWDLFFGCKGPL